MVSLYINASLKNGIIDEVMDKIADILIEFGANYNMNKIDRASSYEADLNQLELFDNVDDFNKEGAQNVASS